MTKRDMLSVAVKLLALICGIYAILKVRDLLWACGIVFTRQPEEMSPSWLIAYPAIEVVTFLVVALVLGKYADSIAARLVRDDAPVVGPGGGVSERSFFSVSLRIIGLLTVIWVLSVLGGILVGFWQWRGYGVTGPWGRAPLWQEVVSYGVFFIIGCYLLTGAKRLVDLVFREKQAPDPGSTDQ